MYKDPEKQKEAKRLSAQRRRDRAKGTTQGTTIEGTTPQGTTGGVESSSGIRLEAGEPEIAQKPESEGIPKVVTWTAYPGGPDCACGMCKNKRSAGKPTDKLWHGKPMSAVDLNHNGFTANRVSLPGDSDYKGVAV